MKKLTIESEEFYNLMQTYRVHPPWMLEDIIDSYKAVIAHIDEKLAEAYEQGKRDKLPTIEWESSSAPQVPRAALTNFIKNWCQDDSEKVSLASAAFYACANAIQGTSLPKEPT